MTRADIARKIKSFFSKREKTFFLLFSLFTVFEYIFLGPFSYVRVGDNLDIFIPRFQSLASNIATHGITYWDPLFAGGIDRIANDLLNIHLSSMIFNLVPSWLAYGTVLFLSIFIGSYFTFRICHKQLELKKAASLLASFIFAQSLILIDIIPFMIGLSFVPFSIFYLQEIFNIQEKIKYLYAILLGILFGFASSVVFTLPFALVAIFLWFVFVKKDYSVKKLLILFLFSFASIIAHLPAVWSMITNTPLSNRVGGYYNANLINYLVTVKELLVQNYLSLLIIALAILGSKFFDIKNRYFKRTSILVFLGIFVVQYYRPLSSKFGDYLGPLADFGFDRFSLLVPFFASIAAAIAINSLKGYLVSEKSQKKYLLYSIFVSVFIVLLVFSNLALKTRHAKIWLKSGSYHANTYSPDLDTLKQKTQEEKNPFRVALISNEESDLRTSILNMNGFESIDGDINMTSKRFAEYFNQMAKFKKKPKHSYYFFWQASEQEKEEFMQDSTKFINQNLLSLANVKYLASYLKVSAPGFSKIESPSATIDHIRTKGISNRIKENFTGKKLLIYENKNVLDRFFLVGKVRVFENKDELLNTLSTSTFDTLSQEVYLEEKDLGDLNIESLVETKLKPELIKYSPDQIVLKANLENPTILIISNNYHPFWSAYINQEKKEVIPAYHSFMALPLLKGENLIELKYQPPYKFGI